MILILILVASTCGNVNYSENPFPEENAEKSPPWIPLIMGDRPHGFPLHLSPTNYANWPHDIVRCFVWTAYPQNAEEVVAATNWARANRYELHASGSMHNWSPFTLTKIEEHPGIFGCGMVENGTLEHLALHRPSPVILLKTAALNKMEVTSTQPGDSFFWTEPGVLVENLAQELEHKNLSLLALTSTGKVTIGGVLAFGGHGTGVPATGEILSNGHTYGSLSNLILSFTAVIYNATAGKYVLKEFQRSDPEAKAFMVNLGRTFITNFTLRAGPLQYLRCRSKLDIPASSLFAPTEGPNSFSLLLSKYGRLETILYPFTNFPWLKVWSVEPVKPIVSREVTTPYNYPFSNSIPESISLLVKAMVQMKLYNFSRLMGKTLYVSTVGGLVAANSLDIWGPSKNTLLYDGSNALRFSGIGYAVLTARSNVQRVVHETYTFYNNSLHGYEQRGLFPISGGFEVRASGLDVLEDVLIEGAQGASLSPLGRVDGSDFDTAVWISLGSYFKTPSCGQFMREMENFLHRTFDGRWALARAEWPKGWAYTDAGPWTNQAIIQGEVKTSLRTSEYKAFVDTMVEHDPHFIFTNDFTKEFFSLENHGSL